ncbi:hypothetical protein CBM2586_A10258 [Cupriavidus phytorum]|uniref:Uncharacterized protein n=1 Tax=Cupriavidus taiwanensis TaxID=164546 RepID=A0A975ZVK0_9BURK|nr:hypothetical protein CBM2586_A10258 [Cupriavidus taiwanensis]
MISAGADNVCRLGCNLQFLVVIEILSKAGGAFKQHFLPPSPLDHSLYCREPHQWWPCSWLPR